MLYFAYGSNMDFERMRQRSPNARFLFRAMLLGYELAFTRQMRDNKGGAADIRDSAGARVWGVAYLPRKVAFKMRARVGRGGTRTMAQTIASRFFDQLGNQRPDPISGRAFLAATTPHSA
jgi:hypothetical protein